METKLFSLDCTNRLNPFIAEYFFAILQGHGDNFLQTLTWHGLSFSLFTVWYLIFSLILMFPGLRIEDVKTKISFCLSKVVSPGADLSAFRFTFSNRAGQFIGLPFHIVESSGPIYRPSVSHCRIEWANLSAFCFTLSNRAGQFISHPCQLDKIFAPIYRPTAAKGLNMQVM